MLVIGSAGGEEGTGVKMGAGCRDQGDGCSMGPTDASEARG